VGNSITEKSFSAREKLSAKGIETSEEGALALAAVYKAREKGFSLGKTVCLLTKENIKQRQKNPDILRNIKDRYFSSPMISAGQLDWKGLLPYYHMGPAWMTTIWSIIS
jgi:hypothetical protein